MCPNVTVRYGVLLVAYVTYLLVGASLFSLIERPEEQELKKTLNIAIEKFLVDHRHCVTDEQLDLLLRLVIQIENRGVSAAKRNDSMATNWNFGESVFFAASVLTTIGYGNVTPLSEGGKWFCVGYAFIGIILTTIVFDATVMRLLKPTSKFLNLTSRCILSCWPLRCKKSCRIPSSRFGLSLLRLSIVFVLLFLVVFLIPSIVLDVLEKDWNFFDAFYYCFISLTTIGLGDYVPADEPHLPQRETIYKICVTVYLYVGLILVLLAVTNVYQVPELNFYKYFSTDTNSVVEDEVEKDEEGQEAEEEEERQYLQPLIPPTARIYYSAPRNPLGPNFSSWR